MLSILVDSAAANEQLTKYYIKFSTILLKLRGSVETTIKDICHVLQFYFLYFDMVWCLICLKTHNNYTDNM